MDNPEILAILGTGRIQTKQRTTTQDRKLKPMSKIDPVKKLGVNPGAGEREAVPASLKTPVMLLIYM